MSHVFLLLRFSRKDSRAVGPVKSACKSSLITSALPTSCFFSYRLPPPVKPPFICYPVSTCYLQVTYPGFGTVCPLGAEETY